MTEAGAGASAVAWVGLGSNIGRRAAALTALRSHLEGGGVVVEAASRQLLTRAVGMRRQPDFLNQVLRLRSATARSAAAWLDHCESAARAAGRRPTYEWGPRRADADVLLLGERGELRVEQPAVHVPHPQLENRPFLCALLAELDPGLTHPDGWRFAGRAGVFLLPPALPGR